MAAAARIAGAVARTPSAHSRTLSSVLGCTVVVKFENLQYVAAFKERGALNKLLQLDEGERAKGVVAMSAGNHAQAVAYHATRLGIDATIVMPTNTPFVKVQRTRELGATVVLRGGGLAEAEVEADRLAAEEGRTYVHPFDDPAVIAGQGTCALELLADHPELDTLVVPVGGGGLLAGHGGGRPAPAARHPPRGRADRALPVDGRPPAPHHVGDRGAHDRRGHRGPPGRRAHGADRRGPRRRRRDRQRGARRGGHQPAPRDREGRDRGGGGGRHRRPGRAPRALRRPDRRRRAVGRQRRPSAAGVGGHAGAHPQRAAVAPAHRGARRAGQPGHASRRSSARSAPTSSRSSTSGCSSTCPPGRPRSR